MTNSVVFSDAGITFLNAMKWFIVVDCLNASMI